MSNQQNDIYYEQKREWEAKRLAEIEGYKPKPKSKEQLLCRMYKTINKLFGRHK